MLKWLQERLNRQIWACVGQETDLFLINSVFKTLIKVDSYIKIIYILKPLFQIDPIILHFILLHTEKSIGHRSFSKQKSARLINQLINLFIHSLINLVSVVDGTSEVISSSF